MTAAIEQEFLSTDLHPIDMAETLAEMAEWEFDRIGEDRIAMAVEGIWRVYSLNLDWSGHDETLRLICSFELTTPEHRLGEMLDLLNLTNDSIRSGCFVLRPGEKLMAFRRGLTLAGGATVTPEQVEATVLTAIGYSDRFYPAFQLVAWADQAPQEALGIAIDQAYGTA